MTSEKSKTSNINITKIYTRNGDEGMTQLVGGVDVRKDDPIVTSYGDMDELISHLGLMRAYWQMQYGQNPNGQNEQNEKSNQESTPARDFDLNALTKEIQMDLYDIGARLACKDASDKDAEQTERLEKRITWLEDLIDAQREYFEDATGFSLPGESLLHGQIHVTRTVCRRWERVLVSRHHLAPIPIAIMGYANRLSDLLYALSRREAEECGKVESFWGGAKDQLSNR